MTQIATVERILDSDYAEISVPRQSACAHDCGGCAGCGVTGQAIRARAANPIGAEPGQRVVVRGGGGHLLGIAALVYLTPVAFFLLAFFLTAVLTPRAGFQYGGAVAGFLAGLLPAILYDRRLRKQGGLSLTIVRFF